MYHGSRQKNSVLPLTRSRKQLPLPQFPSTLILGSVQKEVEMPLYKDLVLYSFRKTTLSPMQAGLGNRLNSVTHKLKKSSWPSEHSHQYVYGRKAILYTDHKPLVSISRKPLASAQSVYRDVSSAYSSMTQKLETGPEERCISPIPYQEPIKA